MQDLATTPTAEPIVVAPQRKMPVKPPVTPWAAKGLTFNEWLARQPIPYTRQERIETVNRFRAMRDDNKKQWESYRTEMSLLFSGMVQA